MPPKKNKVQANGFYMYMLEMQENIRETQGRNVSIPQLVSVANPEWRKLSAEQKAFYNDAAKKYKQGVKNGTIEGPPSAPQKKGKQKKQIDLRQDTTGRLVSSRYSVEDELKERRGNERKLMNESWPPGKDVIKEKFYMIAFHSLCKLPNGQFLPCEVACIEYSLAYGIHRHFHAFLNPGGIPLGFRYLCQETSESTHQIPVDGHEEARSDYHEVWRELTAFVNPDNKRVIPPLFCEADKRKKVEWCLGWLADQAGISNCLRKVIELELLMSELYIHNERVSHSWTILTDMLRDSRWDHIPNTRCEFHEDLGVILEKCSLGLVQKYCYFLSDPVAADVYNITLTEKHIPEKPDMDSIGTTIYPSHADTMSYNHPSTDYRQLPQQQNAQDYARQQRMAQHSYLEQPPRLQRHTQQDYQPVRRPTTEISSTKPPKSLTQKYYACDELEAPSPSAVPMPAFHWQAHNPEENGTMDNLNNDFQTSMMLSNSTPLSLVGIGRGFGRGAVPPSVGYPQAPSALYPVQETSIHQPILGIGRGRGIGRGTMAL